MEKWFLNITAFFPLRKIDFDNEYWTYIKELEIAERAYVQQFIRTVMNFVLTNIIRSVKR